MFLHQRNVLFLSITAYTVADAILLIQSTTTDKEGNLRLCSFLLILIGCVGHC